MSNLDHLSLIPPAWPLPRRSLQARVVWGSRVVTVGGDAPVRVQLVRYRPSEMVEIAHGENAGKTVTYANIVTSWQILGHWSGGAPLQMQAEVSGADPVVVILQEEGPAEIVAAARLD